MPEKILEVIPNACKEASLTFVRFVNSTATGNCIPSVKIRLPFTIDASCRGNDLYIVMTDEESEVEFSKNVILYDCDKSRMCAVIGITSASIDEILLLHYLEKYGQVLTKILKVLRKYSKRLSEYCTEVPSIAAAADLLMR